jgi:hypothetical protein
MKLAAGTIAVALVVVSVAAGTPAVHEASKATASAVPIYMRSNAPRAPVLARLPLRRAITKDGITWTFSRPARVGRFITGDSYVVGRVVVSAITPTPTSERNGSVKNIRPLIDQTGFDSRTQGERFKAESRAVLPITLVPGDSLVSSISVGRIGAIRRWLFDDAETASPIRTVSVLTSVAAPQPADAFRPSYVGRNSPIYRSSNLRRRLLPRLRPPGVPLSLAEYERHFRRPWIDSLFFSFDTPIEYMPDYGREIARAVGNAALLLTLDYTPKQKEPLLVYLTQYGIDLAGLVRAGHPGWPAHGGHGSGRKLPIMLAATLLGVPKLAPGKARFGEDMQTITGSGWTGARTLFAGHGGRDAGGRYGPYEHLQPRQWPDTLGEDYRRCCTSGAWVAEALAARLIKGVRANWNHPPFFAYVDRWMNEDDSRHLATIKEQIGKDYTSLPQRRAWDEFVTAMWRAYR